MAGSNKIRVAVSGALGRMGLAVCEAVRGDGELVLAALADPGFAVLSAASVKSEPEDAPDLRPERAAHTHLERCYSGLDEALEAGAIDVVVDFTTPAAVRENVLSCIRHRVPAVVGTTGLSDLDLSDIREQASAESVPVLVAPNFAMGAVLMMQFARQAARVMRACEIVELHHDRKLDAPSGTSKLTRALVEQSWSETGLEKEVPIHSVRLPGLVAHQEVIFGGTGETLTIRHDSLSRESFMPGVIMAVKRVRDLQGLVVGLENIL